MAEQHTKDQNGGADSPDPATLGNRPATGARVVENAAHLPTAFGGGQEATDFLGLSQEIAAPEAPAAAGIVHEAMPSARTYGAAADSPASWLLSGREPAAPVETDEIPESEPEVVEPVQASGGSRRLLSLAAAVLLIGAAVTVAMRFAKKESSPVTTLVTNPAPPTARDPSDLAANPDRPSSGRHTILPDGTMVPVETSEPPVDATTPMPVDPTPAVAVEPPPMPARIGAGRLAEWMASHGWSPSSAASVADPLAGAPTTPAGWPTAEAFVFASNARNGMPSAESVSKEIPPTTQSEPIPLVLTEAGAQDPHNPLAPFGSAGTAAPKTQGPGELRFATAEDLANVWGAATVPMELIHGQERMVTPTVGVVRVVLTTGEIFDGRLYAVGEGQVWLETDIGRLALNGTRVRDIGVVVLEKQAKDVEALPRMRVRTPGGLFFGKVLARDDQSVTLLLDNGGRIRLESNDVEPAPLGDIRVVGPVKP